MGSTITHFPDVETEAPAGDAPCTGHTGEDKWQSQDPHTHDLLEPTVLTTTLC